MPTIRRGIPTLPEPISPEARLRIQTRQATMLAAVAFTVADAAATPLEVDAAKAAAIAAIPATNLLAGDYTVATLPAANQNARKYAWVTDLFGGPGDMCLSDGVAWKPVRPLAVSTVANANVAMTLTPLVSAPTQIMAGTLTAARTITLATTYAYKGARFRIKRTAGGLFNLVVAGIGVPLNAWADFEYDGTAWVQTASGGLL